MKTYGYDDIIDAYGKLGVRSGMVVSLKTDLTRLGYYESREKHRVLEDHYRALREQVGKEEGTIVVSTATTNLCETSEPYDALTTPSIAGILTEYIRTQPGVLRSFHAFESYAAVGRDSELICADVSKFSYGLGSPEDRMVKLGAWCIVLGASYERCCSTIHHIESVVGVPYRYMKEVTHPVVVDGSVRPERFYRNVWYKRSKIEKDTSRFFERLRELGFEVRRAPLGNGWVVMYNLTQLYELGSRVMTEEPYIVLAREPGIKPWAG